LASRHRTLGFTDPTGTFVQSNNISQNVDMGLIRLNYRWGGPVVARY
jgi:outer membrane immunogenic protein